MAIHLYSRDASRVETAYSNGFFPAFSGILRQLTGWIPFSIGDLLYGALILWIFYGAYRMIRKLRSSARHGGRGRLLSHYLLKSSLFVITLYIVFNLFWGINYNREGIASQLKLEVINYSPEELKDLNCLLIDKINMSKAEFIHLKKPYPTRQQMFERVSLAYEKASLSHPYFMYKPVSIKASLWGWLGNYTGFTGYYNPFTGEAQVNTTVPKFLHPFITCHEVAHQLGYAKEMEANFVGYLVARESGDPLITYSTYLDLFTYANRSLYYYDSLASGLYRRELSDDVKKDIHEWRAFNDRHRNPVEPIIRWLYGKFLQGNMQPQGIYSYDEVTAFIIAFYKKYGTI